MLYFPLGNYTQEKKEVYEDVCLTTSLTNTWPYESFDKCLSLSFFIFSMAKPIFIFLWLFIGYSWWIYNAFRFSHPGTFYLPHITQLKNNSKPLGSNLLKASHNEKKKKKIKFSALGLTFETLLQWVLLIFPNLLPALFHYSSFKALPHL